MYLRGEILNTVTRKGSILNQDLEPILYKKCSLKKTKFRLELLGGALPQFRGRCYKEIYS